MQFAWDEVNEAEILAHDVSKATAEAVFQSEDFAFRPHHTIPNRWTNVTKLPKTMSEDEFMALLGPGEPLEVLQARHAEDVALATSEMDKPLDGWVKIRILPGRPPKGQEAPTQLKGLKMPTAFWDQMEALARASGLNLHAAMREAVIKWTNEHRPKAG